MTNDKRTPRPRSHHDRGIPVEVDPELTPPPMEMPLRPRSDWDSIPPEIADKLRFQEDKIRELTQALGRVWDARDTPRDIRDLASRLDTVTSLQNESIRHHERLNILQPMVRALTSHVEGIVQSLQKLNERSNRFRETDYPQIQRSLTTLENRVEGLDDRLDNFEKDSIRTKGELDGAGSRHTRTTQVMEAMTMDFRALESRLKELEDDKKIRVAIAKRERKKSNVLSGAVGGGVGLLTSLLERLLHR